MTGLPVEWPSLVPVSFHGPAGEIDPVLLRREKERRGDVQWFGGVDREFREFCLVKAERDPVFWFDQFVWTFDPRQRAVLPMVLWPKQRDYIRFVDQCVRDDAEFLAEKSRDVGVTYLNAGYSLNKWRFVRGFKTTFCANKLDLVDVRGNPDSIFEKIRGILHRVPSWVRPAGFAWKDHSGEAKLQNPELPGNVITGEGGDNAGRGGRSSLYLIDEAAHIERADHVDNATIANGTRGWCSSVNGNGNLFYRLRHGGKVRVFTFHWRDDPRKTEAWARERRALSPVAFAQEYDLDYGASIEDIAIPAAWVNAARELYRRMPDEVARFRAQKGTAGWDIGGGRAETALVLRHGPVLDAARSRTDPDGIDVAYWALDIARQGNIGRMNYDSVGVGVHMGSILSRAATQDVEIQGVNVGVPPTERIWPDGKTSKQKFRNLKAELWWRAREAFNRSWLHLRHLDGDPAGIEYRADELVLMADDDELARQLSTPKAHRTETGLIMIETKEQLARRGIKSPDRADAAVLAFHDDPVSSIFVGDL